MSVRRISKRTTRIVAIASIGGLLLAFVGFQYFWPILLNWRNNQEDVRISSATISVRDQGVGSPAVIIIHGMGCKKDDYRLFQKTLAQYTRVLSYDRPGMGDSSRNSEPRTLDYMDKDLTELLQVTEVPPPYILIGHSMGGLFIRYFADHHPDMIAGLVFLDTSEEEWWQYIKQNWSVEDQQHYFSFWDVNNPDYTGVRREEKSAFEENSNMVRGLKIASDVPVLIFTAGTHQHFRKNPQDLQSDRQKWFDLHESLLAGVKKSKHITKLDWNHWLHYDNPDYVVSEIVKFFHIENKGAG